MKTVKNGPAIDVDVFTNTEEIRVTQPVDGLTYEVVCSLYDENAELRSALQMCDEDVLTSSVDLCSAAKTAGLLSLDTTAPKEVRMSWIQLGMAMLHTAEELRKHGR